MDSRQESYRQHIVYGRGSLLSTITLGGRMAVVLKATFEKHNTASMAAIPDRA